MVSWQTGQSGKASSQRVTFKLGMQDGREQHSRLSGWCSTNAGVGHVPGAARAAGMEGAGWEPDHGEGVEIAG